MMTRAFFRILAVSVAAGFFQSFYYPLNAQELEGKTIPVIGNFWSGKNVKDDKKCKGPDCELAVDRDISGAICLDNGRCFVVSDESRFVQEFYFVAGSISAGQRFYLKETDEAKERSGKVDEFDLEALASSKNKLFAVGSHSWKRKKCQKQKSRRQVFQVSSDALVFGSRRPVTSVSLSLKKAIKKFPELKAAYNEQLQGNGLNIEGAAVSDNRLYFGFRGPYGGNADRTGYLMSIPLSAIAAGNAGDAQLHRFIFAHPGTGIRAMEPIDGGFLVLTGNAGANAGKEETDCENGSAYLDVPPAVYLLKTSTPEAKLIGTIALPEVEDENDNPKPEAILIDRSAGINADKLEFIIFYDSLYNGGPQRFSIARSQLH